MKQVLVFLLLFAIQLNSFAQAEKYWVRFTDKKGVDFNPYTYFDSKAIQRRIKNNIPLVEESDKPVNPGYLKTVRSISDSVTGITRWFNAVACYLTEKEKREILRFPFVKDVTPITGRNKILEREKLNQVEKSLLTRQTSSLEGNKFDSLYTGRGIRICIIDAGFPGVNTSDLFFHIRANNRIIKTWDFKKDKPEVYRFNSHGTSVLSCIAGIYKGQKMGLATDAEFLLARTERTTYEGIAEEEDWLEAVEWADRNGADIINSSLGYTEASHFVEDMDGNTTVISRAANLAARKGILVVIAAGNEGDSPWKYVAAPADADSALTVGGINPWTGLHTSFSSYGPNATHRLKPNVSAFAHTMAYSRVKSPNEVMGTSFAAPLIAGFAACAWQKDTSLTNMQLYKEIEKSASLYPYYDYAVGYGMPKAGYFTDTITENTEPTFVVDSSDKIELRIIIKENYFKENNWINTVRSGKNTSFFHLFDHFDTNSSIVPDSDPNVLYFHVENRWGYLDLYEVIAVNKREVFRVFHDQYKGERISFHYKGYTEIIQL